MWAPAGLWRQAAHHLPAGTFTARLPPSCAGWPARAAAPLHHSWFHSGHHAVGITEHPECLRSWEGGALHHVRVPQTAAHCTSPHHIIASLPHSHLIQKSSDLRSASGCAWHSHSWLHTTARQHWQHQHSTVSHQQQHDAASWPWQHITTNQQRHHSTASTVAALTPERIRNLCIIAHIDHGKTTLADQLLRQAGRINTKLESSSANKTAAGSLDEEASLDSGELERERGITILSKVTSFDYKGHVVNLVDTPGHADFGGEVERILGLVDGAILVVDASEGPLAQTKFVLGKALARGLAPIVFLNKVDKPSATAERCALVESNLFDLFALLGADDRQLDFPVLYGSARQGWARLTYPAPGSSSSDAATSTALEPLLDALLKHVPPPRDADVSAPFCMSVAMVERDPYVGRVVTGRIHAGSVQPGDFVKVMQPAKHVGGRTTDGLLGAENNSSSSAAAATSKGLPMMHKVVRLSKRVGMQDVQLARAVAGDVVSVFGMPAAIGDTVAANDVTHALDSGAMDPPTLRMVFSSNDSPFAGRAGKAVTGRVIGERLMAQAETSVSLTVEQLAGATEQYEVCARGELQLAVLIEGMRREGMELAVSPPAVLTRMQDGKLHEPIEEVTAEVDDAATGQVIEMLSVRKGELLDMQPVQGGRQRLVFKVPSRGLIGFKPLFVNLTRGEGLLSREFLGYEKHRGPFASVRKGVLVSNSQGPVTRYALTELMQRGVFFVVPGEEVYEGQVVGEHIRDEDLDVNPTREKHLSNVRKITKDIQVPLPAPKILTLEEAMGYIGSDELLEVTPEAVRVRKTVLAADKRKWMARMAKSS